MKIAITAESTVDLTTELKDKYDIKTLPFTVLLGEKTFLDGEVSTTEIFEEVKQTGVLPKTSAVNAYQYEEFFTKLLNEYDAVVHFSLSSEISCAYNNAKMVASKMQNVYVIDTRSLSTGIALLAIKARKFADDKLSPKEIVEKCTKLIPNVRASFVIDKLTYLYKGGRCSMLSMLGANLLRIKPSILVENGKMKVGKKYMGKWTECLKKYYNDIMERNPNVDKDQVFITYTTAPDEIVDYLKNKLKESGFKNINPTHAGCTIASHCGENTLGVLFIAKD